MNAQRALSSFSACLSITAKSLRWFSIVAVTLACLNLVQAAMLEGSKPREWPANPARHKITIVRDASDKPLGRMIALAEAAPPAAAELKKAIGDTAAPAGESQWWYCETLGIRVPFAVTGACVAYFSKLIEGYRQKTFNRFIEPSSSLDYRATAAAHPRYEHGGKTYTDVYVVTLKLVFSAQFAASATEGIEIQKERTVILDSEGKVLSISGDGPTDVPVMAI